jgi:hypothetical protein
VTIRRYIFNPVQPIVDAVQYDATNIADIVELAGTDAYTITDDYDGAGHKLLIFDDYSYPNLYEGFYLVRIVYPHRTQWVAQDQQSFEEDYALANS